MQLSFFLCNEKEIKVLSSYFLFSLILFSFEGFHWFFLSDAVMIQIDFLIKLFQPNLTEFCLNSVLRVQLNREKFLRSFCERSHSYVFALNAIVACRCASKSRDSMDTWSVARCASGSDAIDSSLPCRKIDISTTSQALAMA